MAYGSRAASARRQAAAGLNPRTRGGPMPDTDRSAQTPTLPDKALVVVRGLEKEYGSPSAPVRALRGVNLSLAQGEFVALVGPSGSGKSTLLNLVAGLDRPSRGEIVLCQESITGRSENELARLRRRLVGVVFQFFQLLESVSVLDNVAFPMVIAKTGRR